MGSVHSRGVHSCTSDSQDIAPDLAVPVIGPEPLIEDFGDLDRALIETDSAWHGHALRLMRLDLDVHAFASVGSGDCSGAIDSRVAMAGRDPANGLTRSRIETAKATLGQKSCPRLLHLLGVAAAYSIGILRTGLCQFSNQSPLPGNGNWKKASRDRRPKPAPKDGNARSC